MSETINLSKDDGYDKKQNGKSLRPRGSVARFGRAVRMVFEHQDSYETQAAAIAAIAAESFPPVVIDDVASQYFVANEAEALYIIGGKFRNKKVAS